MARFGLSENARSAAAIWTPLTAQAISRRFGPTSRVSTAAAIAPATVRPATAIVYGEKKFAATAESQKPRLGRICSDSPYSSATGPREDSETCPTTALPLCRYQATVATPMRIARASVTDGASRRRGRPARPRHQIVERDQPGREAEERGRHLGEHRDPRGEDQLAESEHPAPARRPRHDEHEPRDGGGLHHLDEVVVAHPDEERGRTHHDERGRGGVAPAARRSQTETVVSATATACRRRSRGAAPCRWSRSRARSARELPGPGDARRLPGERVHHRLPPLRRRMEQRNEQINGMLAIPGRIPGPYGLVEPDPHEVRSNGNRKRGQEEGRPPSRRRNHQSKERDFFLHLFFSISIHLSLDTLHSPLLYLISLLARASTSGGIVRPIRFAVLRLMINSNFVACCTGKSAGLAPFKILST